MMKLQKLQDNPKKLKNATDEMTMKLNKILARIVKGVRENFKGEVTYSAGTWEPVAWTMFDAVGVDYYRDTQTDEEYLKGLDKYFKTGKPVWVMEVGACTYEGAAKLGGGGFTILQGVDKDGNGIYADSLCVSPKYLSMIVKQESGRNASDFIDELVIFESKALLMDGRYTVQQVAEMMDFPNPSFFAKYFRLHCGISPSGYRKHPRFK